MRTFVVTVLCRKRGAIGRFDPKDFTVNTIREDATFPVLFEDWYETYGDAWEPCHIIRARIDLTDPAMCGTLPVGSNT